MGFPKNEESVLLERLYALYLRLSLYLILNLKSLCVDYAKM